VAYNNIYNNQTNGIYFTGSAMSNYIVHNSIYSNDLYGIYLFSGSANFNFIMTNEIWGTDQDVGIRMIMADYNVIRSNAIHHIGDSLSDRAILIAGSGVFNTIENNNIYSNASGIYTEGNNTSILNNRISECWGASQSGIETLGTDKTRIEGNIICKNSAYGIRMPTLNSYSNVIINNSIYSNGSYGIYTTLDGTLYNLIISNRIWANSSGGMRLSDSDYLEIYRNRIYDNINYGILVSSDASNVKIINNTIFGSTAGGILWQNSSSGTMINNIILSNGDAAGEYGIENTGTGLVFADYNDIYGVTVPYTNSGSGILDIGPNNVYTDPMISGVSSFTIASASSGAVNSGLIYPPVTDGYKRGAPDMGWWESDFTNVP
jgi:parallel beta-helix repeat protein